MKKEFIPYEQALALKELGFDESCLAFYWITGKFYITVEYPNYVGFHKQNQLGDYNYDSISAPTFSQTFRWFREKYNLIFQINYLFNGNYQVVIHKNTHEYMELIQYLNSACVYEIVDNYSYEEAELECLKKLIEIVKDGK